MDACDRLWSIDSRNQQILIINIFNEEIIRVPLNVSEFAGAPFTGITVDADKSNCDNAYAYIHSASKFAFLVFRLRDKKYWRIGNPDFIDSTTGLLTKNLGLKRALTLKRIQSTTLSQRSTQTGFKTLYVQQEESRYMLTVPTYVLRNSEKVKEEPQKFTIIGFMEATDRFQNIHYDVHNSILFYNLVKFRDAGGISCWNAKTFPNEFSSYTNVIVEQEEERFINVVSVKSGGQKLYILTKKDGLGFGGEGEVEYSLYVGNMTDLYEGTVCEPVSDSVKWNLILSNESIFKEVEPMSRDLVMSLGIQ